MKRSKTQTDDCWRGHLGQGGAVGDLLSEARLDIPDFGCGSHNDGEVDEDSRPVTPSFAALALGYFSAGS